MGFVERDQTLSSMTPIEKALRNQKALTWYNGLSAEARYCIRAEYARALGCPIDEVVEDMAYDDDIDWMWTAHRARIERISVDKGRVEG